MKILIVEDEALTAISMQYTLEDQGHTVVQIADNESSAIAAAIYSSPDLAFVDLHLAGGDSGIEVARQLATLDVKVVFSTANCPGDEGTELAIGCIHKPVSDKDLVGAVAWADALIRSVALPALPPGMHLY